ncbi:hypothetical protein [Photobacterium sp. 1_MG-2023]|uniref:hypothetical protein n=1 Tax=Photobacterium sp. 1_MG-2023 TaxID=3062646 RepID=UPI0026E2A4AC|nr:hypothetical protein [Photobacterium sp. 1_MG-2023]MDO6705416.1 hypothetical protein [Photobacterium sp. 1_MG-2023]
MNKPFWFLTLSVGVALTLQACGGGSGGSDSGNGTDGSNLLDRQARLTFVNTAREPVDVFVTNGENASNSALFQQGNLKSGNLADSTHREYTHRWGNNSALSVTIGIWDSKYQLEEEPALTNTLLNNGEDWWTVVWLDGETTNSFRVTTIRREDDDNVPDDQYRIRVFPNKDIRIDYESATASGSTEVGAGKVSSPILMASCGDQFEISATKGEAGNNLDPIQLDLCSIPDLEPGDSYLVITSDDDILYAVEE